MLTKINDDGVEREKADLIETKGVSKLILIMSVKFV